MKYLVNCNVAPYDVYIGRPSKWGNPFSHISTSSALFKVPTREMVIECYAEWLFTQDHLLIQIPTLAGKILGCHCPPLRCHGEILVQLANPNEVL